MAPLSPRLRACAVCRNADGRLDVFAVHSDRSLRHIWQTAPKNHWSPWEPLRENATSAPAVVLRPSGRLDVVVAGANKELRQIWQSAPEQSWSGWVPCGGAPVYGPAAAINKNGVLEVFARRDRGQLWRTIETSIEGGWPTSWTPHRVGIKGTPTVRKNADGRLELIAQGSDDYLGHIWQDPSGKEWSKWKSFPIGGSDVACIRDVKGCLAFFTRGALGDVWATSQTAASNGWDQGHGLGGEVTTAPAVGMNADGRLEVFARGTDNALWHTWQTGPDPRKWSPWKSLGGRITSEPTCVRNYYNCLEVFARGTDGALWHRWQTSPNNGWSTWHSLGGKLMML